MMYNVWDEACVCTAICVEDVRRVLRVTMRGNVSDMRASRCWYLDGTCDWPWRAEWRRWPRARRRIDCRSKRGARTCAVNIDWYALRGPYSGRLNVRVSDAVAEPVRVIAMTTAVSHTLDGGRERSPPARGISEGRVLSTESEIVRFLDSEYQDVEYPRLETLASWIRSIRMPSTLDWKREHSLTGFGISRCRVSSTGNENARLLVSEYQAVEYSRLTRDGHEL